MSKYETTSLIAKLEGLVAEIASRLKFYKGHADAAALKGDAMIQVSLAELNKEIPVDDKILKAVGSKGNSPKSRGGNNEAATLAPNVKKTSSGTKDAGGEPDRGDGGKGRERDTPEHR